MNLIMPKKKLKKISRLTRKPKQIIGSGRTFDEQKMGSEPIFDETSTPTDIMHGLNWYSHFHEADLQIECRGQYAGNPEYHRETNPFLSSHY